MSCSPHTPLRAFMIIGRYQFSCVDPQLLHASKSTRCTAGGRSGKGGRGARSRSITWGGASRGYTPLHLSAEDVCGTAYGFRGGGERAHRARAHHIARGATAAQASRRGLLAAVTSADLESLPAALMAEGSRRIKHKWVGQYWGDSVMC